MIAWMFGPVSRALTGQPVPAVPPEIWVFVVLYSAGVLIAVWKLR